MVSRNQDNSRNRDGCAGHALSTEPKPMSPFPEHVLHSYHFAFHHLNNFFFFNPCIIQGTGSIATNNTGKISALCGLITNIAFSKSQLRFRYAGSGFCIPVHTANT